MSLCRKVFCPLAAFELSRLRICWKINLDQLIDINSNTLESKGLILDFMYGTSMYLTAPSGRSIFFWVDLDRRGAETVPSSKGVRRIQPHAMNPPYAGPIRNHSFFSEMGEHAVEKYFHYYQSSES
jgi:hypothetical protein